ncbi:tyrosine-type recombinase/integrase [Frankia sp. RB7]|nr:tyrosine-type recombinase/integrase [Frankia sp. RB7]
MATVRKRSWKTAKGETRTAWAVDYPDVGGKWQRQQFASKREADDFRVKIEGEVRSGTFRPEASKITVKEVCELFLEDCEERLARRERMTRASLEWYQGQVYNYICPDKKRFEKNYKFGPRAFFEDGIGHHKLAQLSARIVSDFRDRVRKSDLSVSSTRKLLTTLRTILNFAISKDLLGTNVAAKVKVVAPRHERKNRKRVTPPTPEAMRRIMSVTDQDTHVKLVVAATTGVRAGEFHALRWKHFDFRKMEVLVETRVDRYGEEDVTKTEAGDREIPLSQTAVDELKAWRNRTKYSKPGDLVFPNLEGKYEAHDNMVKREFDPLFKKLAKLHSEDPDKHAPAPKRFNWHALRHFAVSCWIDADLPPKTIQTFAGHSTLAVTMDIYGHLFKKAAHNDAMDAIAKTFVAEGPKRPAQRRARRHPAAEPRSH